MILLIDDLKKANIVLPTGCTNKRALLLSRKVQLYDRIMNITDFLNVDSTFGERIFCIKKSITKHPVCIKCGKKVKYVSRTGYNQFCSLKCSANSQEVREKTVKTNIERYQSPMTLQNDNVLRKAHQTMMEKYGTIHPLQNVNCKHQQEMTMTERYGAHNFNYINAPLPTQLTDVDWLKQQHYDCKRSLRSIARELQVDPTTVSRYFKRFNLDVHHTFTSLGEKELQEFLSHFVELETNVRNIIFPYELDIYIPSHKVAIEYCGLYWHSNIHPRIEKNYHLQKLAQCEQKGIMLITIFEDEWIYNEHLVKRTILNKLGMNTEQRVFARLCAIEPVIKSIRKDFLNEFHLQGDGGSSIDLGIVFNNQVIAVAGLKRIQNNLLLNRFATKVPVVGGFSKLISYIDRHYIFDKIITFADRRWSSGTLYKTTGFSVDKILPPDYRYVVGDKRVHKFNFRRKFLPLRLKFFDGTKSERENCFANRIPVIWDCGLIRFKKRKRNENKKSN